MEKREDMMFLVPMDSFKLQDTIEHDKKTVKIIKNEEVLSEGCVDEFEEKAKEEIYIMKEDTEKQKRNWSWLSKYVLGLLITGAFTFFGISTLSLHNKIDQVTSNETIITERIIPDMNEIKEDQRRLSDDLSDVRVDVAEMSGKVDLILQAVQE